MWFVVHEVYHLKWNYKIKYLPVNGTLRVGGGAWPIRREARLTSRACLPSQRTCYCGAVSKIRLLVYCGYSFVHIICCLFCSFIFCLLVLCYIAHHWIFLRRTVNKSPFIYFYGSSHHFVLFSGPKTSRSRSASVYCITFGGSSGMATRKKAPKGKDLVCVPKQRTLLKRMLHGTRWGHHRKRRHQWGFQVPRASQAHPIPVKAAWWASWESFLMRSSKGRTGTFGSSEGYETPFCRQSGLHQWLQVIPGACGWNFRLLCHGEYPQTMHQFNLLIHHQELLLSRVCHLVERRCRCQFYRRGMTSRAIFGDLSDWPGPGDGQERSGAVGWCHCWRDKRWRRTSRWMIKQTITTTWKMRFCRNSTFHQRLTVNDSEQQQHQKGSLRQKRIIVCEISTSAG